MAQQNQNCRTTKLTTKKVERIRALAAKGVHPTTLAKRYGVCSSTIKAVVAGTRWVPYALGAG